MTLRNTNLEDFMKLLGAGCYQFAVGIYDHSPRLVGDYIGERKTWRHTDQQLLATLDKELRFLGFACRSAQMAEMPNKYERKIYLERDIHTGFYHFLWWNPETSSWWEKEANRRPNEVEKNPKLTTNKYSEGWCFIIS